MKTMYFDVTEYDCAVGVITDEAQVIYTGTTVNAASVTERQEHIEEYEKYARYGIRFIFEDDVPAPGFYAVPHMEIFARDSEGGFFAIVRQTAVSPESELICRIDSRRECFLVAETMEAFLKAAGLWKQCQKPFDGITFYNSKREAEQELDFIRIEMPGF